MENNRFRRDKEYRIPNCSGSLVTVLGHSFVRHLYRCFNGDSALAPHTICVPSGLIRDMELEIQAIPESTRVLFLMVGSNDLAPRTADLSTILDDFLHLLQGIRSKLPNVKVYFVTCSNRIPFRDSHAHVAFCHHYNKRVHEFNRLILRLSYIYKFCLVDSALDSPELLARDMFHPNFNGIEMLASNINNIIYEDLIYPQSNKPFQFQTIPQPQAYTSSPNHMRLGARKNTQDTTHTTGRKEAGAAGEPQVNEPTQNIRRNSCPDESPAVRPRTRIPFKRGTTAISAQEGAKRSHFQGRDGSHTYESY
jgi:hypothetical protein